MMDAKQPTAAGTPVRPDSLKKYIDEIRSIWGDGTDPQLPYSAEALLEQLLAETSPVEHWIAALIGSSLPATELYRDNERGFVQIGYIYEKGYCTSPHDHGPCWVLHGVYHGVSEITTYRRQDNPDKSGHIALEMKETRRLTQGKAVVYLPRDIHSTFVPEPSVILTLFSRDPRTVERNHYHFDGVGFRAQHLDPIKPT
jgi:hypothetical protein